VPGAQCHGLMEDNVVAGLGMALLAWGQCLRGRRHHQHGSGKMATHKGLDRGREQQHRGSVEVSMMARRL
jgi:hypothetical protein